MLRFPSAVYALAWKEPFPPQIDHFFVFLELNHLAFSKEAVILWSSKVSRIARLRNKLHKIYWLYEFSVYRTIGINNVFDSQGMNDDLPNWSRNILEACLTVKKRAGFESSTIAHYKSNGARLFLYLDANGVHSCDQITPELLMDFHKQNHHQPTPSDDFRQFVFIKSVAPYNTLHSSVCKRALADALASEGIQLKKWQGFHILRRTKATALYQNGVPLEMVSTLLGHSQLETTKIYYAKPSVEQLKEAMDKVEYKHLSLSVQTCWSVRGKG